jgi:hypothetical protein
MYNIKSYVTIWYDLERHKLWSITYAHKLVWQLMYISYATWLTLISYTTQVMYITCTSYHVTMIYKIFVKYKDNQW